MRVKAPPHCGDPSVGGVVLKADAAGAYEVDAATGAHLIEAFGFSCVRPTP